MSESEPVLCLLLIIPDNIPPDILINPIDLCKASPWNFLFILLVKQCFFTGFVVVKWQVKPGDVLLLVGKVNALLLKKIIPYWSAFPSDRPWDSSWWSLSVPVGSGRFLAALFTLAMGHSWWTFTLRTSARPSAAVLTFSASLLTPYVNLNYYLLLQNVLELFTHFSKAIYF